MVVKALLSDVEVNVQRPSQHRM